MPRLYDGTDNENKNSKLKHDAEETIENRNENIDAEKLTETRETNNTTADDLKIGIEHRIRGKEKRMLTKTFESKELLPFSQLRTLNQKDLLHSLEQNDKLGIVIKDQLRVAMMDMEKYEQMVNVLQEYERLLDYIEEGELFERIAHRLKSDRFVEYKEGMSLLEMAGIHPKG
jgi:hypothetical protein